MSGGGKIIEKTPLALPENGLSVVRYRVMSEYRPGWFDETHVCAAPAEEEPQIGDDIMWGAEPVIYWGEGDQKRLQKIGYSYGVAA